LVICHFKKNTITDFLSSNDKWQMTNDKCFCFSSLLYSWAP
jgi:hypothetical protein